MLSNARAGITCLLVTLIVTAPATAVSPPAWQRWLARVPANGVTWRNATFGECIEWLRDRDETGAPALMNVVIDRAALESVGVDEDAEVSLELREVPMARILDLLLAQLTPEDQLAYVIDENILRISTKARLAGEMTVRTYDLSGATVSVPDFTNGPTVRMELAERAASSSRQGSTTATGSVLEDGGEDSVPGRSERVAEIVAAIQTSVEPDSWAERGGEGTIAAVGMTLVVRNSAANQEIIAGLLSRLSK